MGATVHFVDEGTDTGPINPAESRGGSSGRYSGNTSEKSDGAAEWKILPRAIDLIAMGKVTVEGNKTVILRSTGQRMGSISDGRCPVSICGEQQISISDGYQSPSDIRLREDAQGFRNVLCWLKPTRIPRQDSERVLKGAVRL